MWLGVAWETLNAFLDARRIGCAMRPARPVRTPATAIMSVNGTKAGEVRLKIPKLRQQTFETPIIERCARARLKRR